MTVSASEFFLFLSDDKEIIYWIAVPTGFNRIREAMAVCCSKQGQGKEGSSRHFFCVCGFQMVYLFLTLAHLHVVTVLGSKPKKLLKFVFYCLHWPDTMVVNRGCQNELSWVETPVSGV